MIAYVDILPPTGVAQRLHKTTTRAITKLDGLVGPTDVRGTTTPRPEAHGVIDPPAQYFSERLIVAEGWLRSATFAETMTDWRSLTAALSLCLSADGTLLWQEDGGLALQSPVRLAGPALPSFAGAWIDLRYQLHLRCPDPIWYSQTEQSTSVGAPTSSGGYPYPIVYPIEYGSGIVGGTVSVTNAGNQTAWPVLAVQGPISGPVLYNTARGETLRFTSLVVNSGQTLTVTTNPRTRAAVVDGASVLGSLDYTAAKFPGISANSTETLGFYGVSGGYGVGTAFTPTWRASYIS